MLGSVGLRIRVEIRGLSLCLRVVMGIRFVFAKSYLKISGVVFFCYYPNIEKISGISRKPLIFLHY